MTHDSHIMWLYTPIKHTTTLFSLSDHDIISREWRGIVNLVLINYHGRPMVLKSDKCDRAVHYEGSSLLFRCILSQWSIGHHCLCTESRPSGLFPEIE